MDGTGQTAVEAVMREQLARANRALGGVAPVLAHKLESPGQSLVNDAIVARLRGMLEHLAIQLLLAAREVPTRDPPDREAVDALAEMFAGDTGILSHLYALAMEAHLAERLERRGALDQVLSPLLQELIASDRPATAELAMEALAAQSRFIQGQRRMHLAIGELPAELFASTIDDFYNVAGASDAHTIARGLATLREAYDEATTRLGLLTRLVSSMRGGAVATLELEHAGLALFASGIATLTEQPRDLVILACHERQAVRLALSLRAVGQGDSAIDRQLALLDPSEWVPAGISRIPPERAALMLDGAISPTAKRRLSELWP